MGWICPMCSTSNDDSVLNCFVCGYKMRPKKLPQKELEVIYRAGVKAYANGEYDTAFENFYEAAYYNYLPALLRIAECYKLGHGTAQDDGKMYEAYMAAAKKEDTSAQYELARCCYFGVGTKKNLSRVFVWVQKAADKDHIAAMKLLATLYFFGEGVEQNCEAALRLYERIIVKEPHDKDAQFGIKRCKAEMEKKELEKLMADAENGNEFSQYDLALRYYEGRGVTKDINKTVLWLKKASGRYHIEACLKLASLYLYDDEAPYDVDAAMEIYQSLKDYRGGSLLDGKNAGRIYAGLGDCYLAKKKNMSAAKNYKAAAKAGYAEGQYQLGLCYDTGTGVFKNRKKAMKWLLSAAVQGHSEAKAAWDRLCREKW